MTKSDALALIDAHKNVLIDPTTMLNWTWLRIIVSNITHEEWEQLLVRAYPTLSS
jgi:hypothetical protein